MCFAILSARAPTNSHTAPKCLCESSCNILFVRFVWYCDKTVCLSVCLCVQASARALSLKWYVFENRHQVFSRCENEMRLPQNAFGIIVYRSFKIRCDICVHVSPPTISVAARRSTLHSDHFVIICIWCAALVFNESFTLSPLLPSIVTVSIACDLLLF